MIRGLGRRLGHRVLALALRIDTSLVLGLYDWFQTAHWLHSALGLEGWL